MNKLARVIAFYLPQFHPIPENDEWWGKGFTEWTNVAQSTPLFPGHYQPFIPSDLGFYDLRLAESRAAQAELAMKNGIEGFCYYHYWYDSRELLEKPFHEVLTSREPDFPFCLCWANHSWSGTWKGQSNLLLVEQTYPGNQDHEKHFYSLLDAFTDDRYITVDGKPIFVIYDPTAIPDTKKTLDFWQELAVKNGLPGIHFTGINHFSTWNPENDGFDSSITEKLPPKNGFITNRLPWVKLQNILLRKETPSIYHYKDMVDFFLRKELPDFQDYPCIIPNWDNSPRFGKNALVIHGSTPELFRIHLKKALQLIEPIKPERKIIFLKAWNEWAEGNYVEPDLKFGHGYLDVIKEEIT